VAEAEAPDFQFSFSDAKRSNEYTTADVDAAMRWFQEGEGTAPSQNEEFVSNAFGSEDASFFDDVGVISCLKSCLPGLLHADCMAAL
jgi:hypothetical protein